MNILCRLLCLLLFLPLALIVSVNPARSALPSYQADREYAPDNVCGCPPDMMPAQLRATQPSWLAYNKANQMATATVSGTASTYVYDAFGQRLTSTVGAGTPVIQQYGMGGLLLSETQGAAETNYVYLNPGSGSGAGSMPVAAINTASPALSYIHTNHLGTPQVATNGSQSVVWSGAYQPFGAVTPTTSITQNLRFPGQYADPTGLHYNMFRNYNPALGRYMESDPIGLAGGINTYNYAANNPYSFVDPSGLFLDEAVARGIMAKAATGGAIGTAVGGPGWGTFAGIAAGTAVGVFGSSKPAGEGSDKPQSPQFGPYLPGSGDAQEAQRFGNDPNRNQNGKITGDPATDAQITAGAGANNVQGANNANSSNCKDGNCGNTNPYAGPVDEPVIVVDQFGNAIPVDSGEYIAASPNGNYQQVKDSNHAATGIRLDRGGHPNQSDPAAQKPHGHVPGVTQPDGNPHLPVRSE